MTSSPLLGTPGAVAAEGADCGVAWHYGDPLREQRRWAAGEAVVDLSHHGVVRVSGPDRLGWLHSLTTQHLEQLGTGVSTEALILSPHGHVEHHLRLVDDGEATWLLTEPEAAGRLAAFLDSMRFMLRVEVVDVTTEWAVVREPLGLPAPAYLSHETAAWRDALVPRGRLLEHVESRPSVAGVWTAEAVRVAARVPRIGLDTDHRTIPHEVGWLDTAVHLDKGCYRGQETVARVYNLGRPPRRLVFCHLDGSVEALPSVGAPVRSGEAVVGRMGTAVRHFELGPIGLALVKRALPVGAPLEADGVAISAETVVDPDIGLHVRAAARSAAPE